MHCVAQAERGTVPPLQDGPPIGRPYQGAQVHAPVWPLPPGSVYRDGIAYVPAGLQPRVAAFILDAIILGLLHNALLALGHVSMGDPAAMLDYLGKMLDSLGSGGLPDMSTLERLEAIQRPLILAGWLNIGMCAAYFTIFHWLIGTTLGKGMLGLRVLRRDGGDLGLGGACLRYLVYLLTAKLAYTAWLVPLDAQRRALHDMAAGTNVFRALPAPQAPPWQVRA
jgi:uncharacterized RDD family membrane protein YckC